MGVQVIPIPTEVVSHSHSQFCVLFPFPWDSHSHWESHFHAHLYCTLMKTDLAISLELKPSLLDARITLFIFGVNSTPSINGCGYFCSE